ncbi:MAG TPA: hypothetical protein VF092_15645 [Longimicrobium sp.]
MAKDESPPESEPPDPSRDPSGRVVVAPIPTGPLAQIATRTDQLLADVDPSPFSSPGFEELKLRIDSYIMELVNESRRIARRHQADVISPAYVQQASDYLVARKSRRKFTLMGSVGGIFLGAAVSSFLDIAAGKQVSPLQVLVSAVLGMLGAFLIALQFARE